MLTVHRSQGSSFGEVFVADDVFWPQDLDLRRQLFMWRSAVLGMAFGWQAGMARLLQRNIGLEPWRINEKQRSSDGQCFQFFG